MAKDRKVYGTTKSKALDKIRDNEQKQKPETYPKSAKSKKASGITHRVQEAENLLCSAAGCLHQLVSLFSEVFPDIPGHLTFTDFAANKKSFWLLMAKRTMGDSRKILEAADPIINELRAWLITQGVFNVVQEKNNVEGTDGSGGIAQNDP